MDLSDVTIYNFCKEYPLDSTEEFTTAIIGENLTTEDINLAIKILQAINITENDIATVNLSSTDADIQFSSNTKIINFFVFGLSPRRIGLNISTNIFRPIHLSDKTYFFSPSLSNIATDKNLKLQLWNSLKQHFLIN